MTYEPPSRRSSIGEADALMGYSELLIAEAFCAGTALNQVVAGGGVQYGTPLSTDSLLGVAVGDFNAALAAANGDATVMGLASVGLGRTLLDRGQYSAAGAAVHNIATSFVYNTELEPTYTSGATQEPNPYAFGIQLGFTRYFNVGDREGENGLPFVSANDPRLTFDSSMTTADGGTWYLPLKFEANPSFVPLATGIEARLIEAEAALQANQPQMWMTDLTNLRADSADTHVMFDTSQVPIKTDSTSAASATGQVDFMFRERAFWLFGTGTRLGDLRRLIRQYGRDQSTVFPTGPYANGHNPHLPSPLPNYGTDVSLTLPTSAGLANLGLTISNPQYKGCTTSTKTA